MHRFFIEQGIGTSIVGISDTYLVHQIGRVLRAKIGDVFTFFNGKDNQDFQYKIIKISKTEITFELIKVIEKEVHNKFVTIIQGIPNKHEKLEYIVQKGVEVGVSRFIFFRSQWSQKLVLSDSKKDRIKKIAIESIEQSGRNIIPNIEFTDYFDFAMLSPDSQKLFLHHIKSQKSKHLKELDFSNVVDVFVGPEGGWSDSEVDNFLKKGTELVYFSGSVLRCETVSSVVTFFIHNR